MTASEIMNNDARWETVEMTAWDYDDAIYPATDNADWRESGVLQEDTLNAQGVMEEVFREVKRNTG